MNRILDNIKQATADLDLASSLAYLAKTYSGASVFSTSFGVEDQLITHVIGSQQLEIPIFTLDTGRLFPETYTLWSRTNERYAIQIETYYPDTNTLETFLSTHGPNAFYESVALRKECCAIRKVQPLKRALAGKKIWITGLRAEQSPDRQQIDQVEWDEQNHIIKFHPLLHFSSEDVFAYVRQEAVLYNPLHDKGFVSIGCAPCTRAIQAGENFRAGRWWWEDNAKKECGLHH